MIITVTRTRKVPDGSITATAEVRLDDYLDYDTDQLRARLAKVRGTLDAAVASPDPAPTGPQPEPTKHAPAIVTPPTEPPSSSADPEPTTGKELYSWARRRDERLRTTETFSFLLRLGTTRGIGERIVNWSDGDAQSAYRAAVAKLESTPLAKGA